MYQPYTELDSFSLVTNYLLWIAWQTCWGCLACLKISLRSRFDRNGLSALYGFSAGSCISVLCSSCTVSFR